MILVLFTSSGWKDVSVLIVSDCLIPAGIHTPVSRNENYSKITGLSRMHDTSGTIHNASRTHNSYKFLFILNN